MAEDLKAELIKRFNSQRWYTKQELACIMNCSTGKIDYWRKEGIKDKFGRRVYLLMIKEGGPWKTKGQKVIDFLIDIN